MNPEKKLKLILASLKDRQIVKFFQVFTTNFPDQLKKSVRQISYNCYESVCQFKNKAVSGYGKNNQQSYVNSVRTLVQLLADDSKYHSIMRQCLRSIQQLQSSNTESQKKLLTLEKQSMNSLKNVSMNCVIKPAQKKSTLKEEIFEHLNLDNLKISNPNTTHKAKTHEKYMSFINEEDQISLEEVIRKNKELEQKIYEARQENNRLKIQIKYAKKQSEPLNLKQNENQREASKQKAQYANARQQRQNYDPLRTKTNDYLNMSQDTKVIDKSKVRSVSVEASQTQKYLIPKSTNDKKITVPKLNLQVLPNYHGKSNKSLNQSLMEVYQKTHGK